MITQGVFPPDIRIEKEIRSLSNVGFTIFVFCNQFDNTKSERFNGCKIIRLKALFHSVKLNKVFNFPALFNVRLLLKLIWTTYRIKPNLIHAHDLPMVPFGIVLKKIFGIKLISDFHENYPAALEAYQKKGLINYFFKNPKVAYILEKYCIRHSDVIITVVDENKQRLEEMNSVRNNIYVVSNTVDLTTYGMDDIKNEIVMQYEGFIVILYTGVVSKNRGLDTPIKSLKLLISKFPNIKLVIIGNGDARTWLINIAKSEMVDQSVDFIEWPGHNNLASYIKVAKICMIPQPKILSNDTTIPHKLFEYMSKGKNLIVSDAAPLKRIIEETNAGEVFKSFDEKDFACKVEKIIKSNKSYGENGITWVKEKYNWKIDEKILIDLYEKINWTT